MTTRKKRGFLATLGTVLAAWALTLGGALPAQADTPGEPPASSTVTIHKRTQSATVGDHASGQADATVGGQPVPGVVFEYHLVPGTQAGGPQDIGTNAGQLWASGLTAATAKAVPGYPGTTGEFPATADLTGETSAVLPRGLYVVTEKTVPVGVTPAADFLLAVPLTNPDTKNSWLSEIHIYPKNAVVGGQKTVNDGANLTVGGEITWSITADIPLVANPNFDMSAPVSGANVKFLASDLFEIHDTLTNAELTSTPDKVTVTAPAGLQKGTHYTVNANTAVAGQTTYEVIFTQVGRQALANAVNADPAATVAVQLVTKVESPTVIDNEAKIFPNTLSKTTNKPIPVEPATAKYGSYKINKKSSDSSLTGEALAGAQFQVFLTKADAIAGTNPVTTKENASGVWTTGNGGTATVGGLRYSGWANGAPVTKGQAGYQTYWLVETKALPGHQLLAEPIEIVIDDNSATHLTELRNIKTSGSGFELPLTGGAGTALLTIGGIALLAVVAIVARRRRTAE